MKITVMTTDEQIVTLDVDRDESVIISLSFFFLFLLTICYGWLKTLYVFLDLTFVLLMFVTMCTTGREPESSAGSWG